MRNAAGILGVLVVAVLAVAASAAEGPAMPLPQTWSGRLVSPTTSQRLGVDSIQIRVSALSSNEEVQTLARELMNGGQAGLRQAMFLLEQKAWVQIGTAAGTSVGLVRVLDLPDGGRRLRLVSEFPARVLDSSDPVGSLDHPFAFVELRVGPDGTGKGDMVAAASIGFSDQGIVLESAGEDVIQIIDVATDSLPR